MPICDPLDPMYNFFVKDQKHDSDPTKTLDVLPFLFKHHSIDDAYHVGYALFEYNEKTTYLRLWEYWGLCNSIDTSDFAYYWFNVFI